MSATLSNSTPRPAEREVAARIVRAIHAAGALILIDPSLREARLIRSRNVGRALYWEAINNLPVILDYLVSDESGD